MRRGIFARTFSRPTVEEVFDAVREQELDCVQFNMACADLPSLPDDIAPSLIAHAKDQGADDTFQAAGGGIRDYDQYVHLLRAAAFDGPLILHGLPEGQVGAALQFLRGKLQRR